MKLLNSQGLKIEIQYNLVNAKHLSSIVILLPGFTASYY